MIPVVSRWKVFFPTPAGPDERTAYLYLPEFYEQTPDTRYPVLYMFDGHNIFFDSDATYGKCWGMGEYLDRTHTPLIVAALECSHDPAHGRLKEYAPYTFTTPELGRIEGRGRKTMEWMIHTFKADIDRRYRTLPDREHTYAAGSSMGGLLSLYAVLAYNAVFSRAAALSPSLWISPAQLEDLVKMSVIQPDTLVYMDYGSREIKFHKEMRAEFEKMTVLLLQKRIFLTSRIVPFGNHCEASWEKQLPTVMSTLLYEP